MTSNTNIRRYSTPGWIGTGALIVAALTLAWTVGTNVMSGTHERDARQTEVVVQVAELRTRLDSVAGNIEKLFNKVETLDSRIAGMYSLQSNTSADPNNTSRYNRGR